MPVLCNDDSDVACLITEQIWGNCEHGPNKTITKNANLIANDSEHYIASNKILEPKNDSSTILSWFAYNTGTSTSDYNCSVSELRNTAIFLKVRSIIFEEFSMTKGYC
jgi:hypothetical protein